MSGLHADGFHPPVKLLPRHGPPPHSLLPAKSSLSRTLLELHGSHAAILWIHHLPVQQEGSAKAQKIKVQRACMQCGHQRLGMWCLSPSRRPVDKDVDGIAHDNCQPAGHSDGMIGSSATSPRMSQPESGISPVERKDVSSQPFCRHKTCSLHPRAWWPCFRQASETGAFLPLVVLIFSHLPCSHGR